MIKYFNLRVLVVLSVCMLMISGCESKPKVIQTESGLTITDLVTGEGKTAGEGSSIKVHYTGWLYDEAAPEGKGEKFDSSLDRDAAFAFMLGAGKVIKGWDEGVVGMNEGGKRRIVIPSALAYGERGAGDRIPPNSTLVFDIELLSTESLEIIDTVVGDGDVAVDGAQVSVHYTGWLFDADAENNKGAKFDSSVDRGQHFDFFLGKGNVIKGWDKGVKGMKVGGKRTLIIPSTLAYGRRGAGSSIPPNAKLVFDVELFEVSSGDSE